MSDEIVPAQRPAGWYDDGTGVTRWWSGQGWTEHQQPTTPTQNPYPVGAAAVPIVQRPVVLGAPLPPKDTGIAYLFWLLLGVFGGHQFYMGKIGRGFLYLFTGGVLGIMVLIDVFTIPAQIRNVNAQRAVGIG